MKGFTERMLVLAGAAWLALAAALAAPAQDAAPPAGGEGTWEVVQRAEGARETSRGERIAAKLRERGMSENATIFSISLLPIVELRGAIPVGHLLLPRPEGTARFSRADWVRCGRIFLFAVLGNMLPVPFILLLLGPVSRLCMKVAIGKRFFEWLFARTRRKTADIEKYEFFGLTVFVAVPLPVTGAWTGAMAGWLLGMNFWHALLSIFLGVCIAGVIMTALSLMGWIGAAIAGVVLLGLLLSVVFKPRRPAAA